MSASHRRWVSWAAVSSLPQAKKISIDDQLQINREHCAKHGGQLVAELVVPGESRSIVLFEDAARRIEAYAELKRLIDARAFDVLVYLDPSRLGRIDALVLSVRALCRQASIICYETDNPPAVMNAPGTYDDDLLSAIKAVGAEREVKKMTARHASGMIGRVKAGKHPGTPPYGYVTQYHHDGQRFIQTVAVDEDAAPVVRRLFAMYLDGRSPYTIAAAFNTDGICTPGNGVWTRSAVRSILIRVRRYAGYVELNVNAKHANRPYFRGPGAWPPLIDEDTMQRVLTEIAARRKNHKLADAPHVLTGVCYCADCGGVMAVARYENHVRRTDYVRCERHRPTLFGRTDRILAALRRFILDLPNHDLDTLLADDSGDTAAIDAAMSTLAAALARLEKARDRANTAYVDGHLDAADYAGQVQRLKAQEAQLHAEVARLQAQAAAEAQRGTRRIRASELADAGIAILDGNDPTAANAWLRARLRLHIRRDGVDVELI